MASTGFEKVGPVQVGMTALAGGAAPTLAANTLSGGYNVVATVTTAGDSTILPANMPQGGEVFVFNTSAAKMDIYPNSGGQINAAGADVNLGLATKTGATFVQVGTDGLTWVADNLVAAQS